MPSKQIPVIVIHGGAGAGRMSAAVRECHRRFISDLLLETFGSLQAGASALECVTVAVQALEDNPLYNAGYGSKIQSDGKIRMSAAIMEATRSQRRFAGCVNVQGVKNPVHLAKLLMNYPDRVLSCDGATRFARHNGLPFSSPYTAAQRQKFYAAEAGQTGTVGAVCVDSRGRCAAATSTGGRGHEYPFRVSDSPTTAGNFANSTCAVSATGVGEEIVEFSVASTLCAYRETGLSLHQAAMRLKREARRHRARFGFIAVDSKGHFCGETLTPSMIWGALGPHSRTPTVVV
jgi:L-asparaginase